MTKDRIVVTGIGIISALGCGVEETVSSLKNYRINAGSAKLRNCDISKPVFEVKTGNPNPMEMRTVTLAKIAFEQALDSSGIAGFGPTGVCAGTTVASQLNDIEFYRLIRQNDVNNYNSVKKYLNSNLAEHMCETYDLNGPKATIVNACSSGTDAIGTGLCWLLSDKCEAVVVGGADEINRVPVAGFNSLGILSDTVCKPFDINRNGLNLGEGAAFLVLEKETRAIKRGANIRAVCKGYGTASDAYHLTAPRPDGSSLECSIRNALSMSQLTASDISFINAHGTATPDNDKVEGAVFKRLFGDIDFCSTKGYTGHTLGAAGGVEAAFTILSLEKQWLPKCAGFELPDPEIGIKPNTESKTIDADYALSTSLAFGGNNSTIIFGRDYR